MKSHAFNSGAPDITYTVPAGPITQLLGRRERTFFIRSLDREKTDRLVRQTDLRKLLLEEKTVSKPEMARIVAIATEQSFFMPVGLLAWHLERKLDESPLKQLCQVIATKISPKDWVLPLSFERAVHITRYEYFQIWER